MSGLPSDFCAYPKTPRLFRDIIITEKLDGTNSQVVVWDATIGGWPNVDFPYIWSVDNLYIAAGSRNRWIAPTNDNFGFAAWVLDHAPQLATLGHGRHFGEWWGSGIQRGYGLPKGEKRWSLFNVSRWNQDTWEYFEQARYQRELGIVARQLKVRPEFVPIDHAPAQRRFVPPPTCCSVVPVLYRGPFFEDAVRDHLKELRVYGSAAVPGFKNPEGIVVFHTASGQAFKVTIDNDGKGKDES